MAKTIEDKLDALTDVVANLASAVATLQKNQTVANTQQPVQQVQQQADTFTEDEVDDAAAKVMAGSATDRDKRITAVMASTIGVSVEDYLMLQDLSQSMMSAQLFEHTLKQGGRMPWHQKNSALNTIQQGGQMTLMKKNMSL